jgi:hypothetical protein
LPGAWECQSGERGQRLALTDQPPC